MAFLFWCHRQYVRFIILCQENVAKVWYCLRYHGRDHFVYVPSQWETTLHCNVVSYWLGAYTKWSLSWHPLLYHTLHCFSESKFLCWSSTNFCICQQNFWSGHIVFAIMWEVCGVIFCCDMSCFAVVIDVLYCFYDCRWVVVVFVQVGLMDIFLSEKQFCKWKVDMI